jgi:Tfp pilus assembly protein PilN
MDRVTLDFVARGHRPSRASWLLLAAGALVLAALAAWQQFDRNPQLQARRAHLRRVQTALEARRPAQSSVDDRQLAAEWARAIGVADDLNQPWEGLFHMFERQVDRPVGLLTLESDAAKHQVMLTAEAKNFNAMLAYYRYLQGQKMLRDVVLHAHKVNQQDTERPINFRITAVWVPRP